MLKRWSPLSKMHGSDFIGTCQSFEYLLLSMWSSQHFSIIRYFVGCCCRCWCPGRMVCRWLPPLFLGVQIDGDDEPIETQHLGEDKNEDHADEEPGLLRGATDASITDDTDGVACRQTRETNWKPRSQVHEAPERQDMKKILSRMNTMDLWCSPTTNHYLLVKCVFWAHTSWCKLACNEDGNNHPVDGDDPRHDHLQGREVKIQYILARVRVSFRISWGKVCSPE